MLKDQDDLPRFAELDGEYEILRELGRGGTAVVYLARELELERHVAIKVIRAQYVEDTEAAARLVREARTVAALQHPNIVVLYGTRRLRDGSLALFMQYVPGHTLKAEVAAVGPLPFPRARQILNDIGQALAYAHRHRIVHRDLKPENIYIDDDSGVARLSDFGIARPWDTESGLTLPGAAIGTPAYMSPEQIDGGALDGRSDVYSLGMIGYEMLTGVRPWAGETLFNIIYKQKHEALPSLESARPDIPASLARAVEGALAKDPAERWPDAHRFLAVLAGDEVPEPRRRPAPTAPPPGNGANGTDRGGIILPDADRTTGPDGDRVTAPDGDRATVPDPDSVTVQYRRPAADAAAQAAAQAPTQTEPAPRRQWRHLLPAAVIAAVLLGTAVSAATYPWNRGDDPDDATAASSSAASSGTGQTQPPNAPPAALAYAVLGAVQDGAAGDTLPEPLVLRVEDALGAGVAGAAVRFAVVEGGGELVPAELMTDAAGIAAALYVPGSEGLHRIEARVGDIAAVSFTAVATPAAPSGPGALAAADPPASTTAATSVPAGDASSRPVADAPSGSAAAEPPVVPEAPAPLRVRSGLTAGGTHSCALDGAGSLVCWGGNDRGQLGDGSTTRRLAPVPVTAAEPLVRVVAGVSHSCAIGASGGVWCWGSNASGQLGDGTTSPRPRPVRVSGSGTFTDVAVGTAHTCALAAGGTLHCWGQNTHGQLGDASRTNRSQPVRVAGGRTFRSVVVGWSHTCALDTDGAAWCWGRNDAGQLGDGGTADRPVPVQVAGGITFAALAAGSSHTCGVNAGGAVSCWGGNDQGQLGTGSTTPSTAPVPVRTEERFTAVAAGAVHTCALARDGGAYCWGRNSYGQLGDGTTASRQAPTRVAGGLRFTALTAGGAHSCGGQTSGDWFCWGYNVDGQLGDGSTTSQLRPAAAGRR